MIGNKGFTLVETMIALAVVGILLGIIAQFSVQSLGQSSVESARATLLGESQIAMDKIIRDIRLSAGAEANNRWPDANKAGGAYTWASDVSTLVLATAAQDAGDNVIFADQARYISEKNNVIYFVNNGNLYKRILASTVTGNTSKTTCPTATSACPADLLMLHNVTGFTVKYYNGDNHEVAPTEARSIELNIKTATRKFSQSITSDYTTRAVFRND